MLKTKHNSCLKIIDSNIQFNIQKSIVITQNKINLSSIIFGLSYRTDISDWSVIVLHNLVCSDIDSEQGLRLIVENTMNNPTMLNLESPAAIR